MLLNRGRGRQARCVCGGGGGAQGAVGAAAAEPNRSPPLPLSRAPTQRGQPAGRWGGGVRCRGAGGRGAVGGFRNPRHCPHTQGERVVVVTLGVFVCARVWVGGCAGGGVRGGGLSCPPACCACCPGHTRLACPHASPPPPPQHIHPPLAHIHPPTHPPTRPPTSHPPPRSCPRAWAPAAARARARGGRWRCQTCPTVRALVCLFMRLSVLRARVCAPVCALCVCGVEVGAFGWGWGGDAVWRWVRWGPRGGRIRSPAPR